MIVDKSSEECKYHCNNTFGPAISIFKVFECVHCECRFDDEVVVNDDSVCQSGSFDRILCDVPCSGDGTLVRIVHIFNIREKPLNYGRNGILSIHWHCILFNWLSPCEV